MVKYFVKIQNLSKHQTQLHCNKKGNVIAICFYGDEIKVRREYFRRTMIKRKCGKVYYYDRRIRSFPGPPCERHVT